jgi:hypothetical protein
MKVSFQDGIAGLLVAPLQEYDQPTFGGLIGGVSNRRNFSDEQVDQRLDGKFPS